MRLSPFESSAARAHCCYPHWDRHECLDGALLSFWIPCDGELLLL